MSTPKRYHPAIVSLHWLIALLVFAAAYIALFLGEGEGRRGAFAATGATGTAPGIPPIAVHMVLGITVLVLLLVRLVFRWRTQHPAWATAGNAILDKIGQWTHYALYFFTFAITLTGIVLAAQTNQLARAFGLGGVTPGQFDGQFNRPPGGGFGHEGGAFRFGLGMFHGLSWTILALLILLHVGAALYHQFIRRDHLLGRMWYGKQAE
jgi:cytochrome b561